MRKITKNNDILISSGNQIEIGNLNFSIIERVELANVDAEKKNKKIIVV